MKIVGIDPGFGGGLARLDNGALRCIVMPTFERDGRQVLDLRAVVAFLHEGGKPDHVFIEKAQAMPKQGVTGMFRYGMGFGMLLGMVYAYRITCVQVRPREWQDVMFAGRRKADTKRMAWRVCCTLWPRTTWTATKRSTKAHTGLLDAALICAYGERWVMDTRTSDDE